MEFKVLERFDLFENDGIHLDGLRKTTKEFNMCIQLPSWELKPEIFEVYFENFAGRAINIYMAVTNLPVRPIVNCIREKIFTVTVAKRQAAIAHARNV